MDSRSFPADSQLDALAVAWICDQVHAILVGLVSRSGPGAAARPIRVLRPGLEHHAFIRSRPRNDLWTASNAGTLPGARGSGAADHRLCRWTGVRLLRRRAPGGDRAS